MAKQSALPLILGGAVVAAAILSRKGGGGGSSCPAPDCSGVTSKGGTVGGFRYREFRSSGTDANEELPMIIRFHGLASAPGTLDSAGRSWASSRSHGNVRVIVPEGRITTSSGNYSWWSSRSASKDQVKLAKEMVREGTQFREFLCQITKCRPTAGKPILIGHSQGGLMAYLLATMMPDLIVGSVAASGWLPEALWSAKMAPTLGLHGTGDTIVPYDRTTQYWAAMKAQGAPIATAAFDVGHNPTGGLYRAITDGVNKLLDYTGANS